MSSAAEIASFASSGAAADESAKGGLDTDAIMSDASSTAAAAAIAAIVAGRE